MDYEKKYKEALERAKKFKNGEIELELEVGENIMEYVFPELKESEDEKTRNSLIELFKNMEWDDSILHDYNLDKDKTIAWLEKQGEQKSTLPKWRYKKDNTPLLRDSLILNKYGCVAKSPSGAIVSDVWIIDYDELAKLPKEELEKQGEQKNASDHDSEIPFGARDSELQEVTYFIPKGFHAEIVDDKVVIKKGKRLLSGEDEHRVKDTIYFLESARKHYASTVEIDACIDWLKSIKGRVGCEVNCTTMWKPSNEQMKALAEAVSFAKNCGDESAFDFRTLYEQLEKLREE